MAFPIGAAIGDIHQPNPPNGPSYIYRGDGRWDLYVDNSATDMSNYYTKAQEDVAHAALAAATAAALAEANAPGWAEVSGKPLTFPPEAHAHPTSEIAGLDVALAGKAATGHAHTKADVGLGNVNNTTDLLKPISTATQAALDAKQPLAANLTSWAAIAPAAKLDAASYTAADIKTKLLTVDGAASTIDADLVDGYHAASFVRTVNGGGPDGAGNVVVAAGVQDVRLGSVSEISATGSYSTTDAPTGNVLVGQRWGDALFAFRCRPLQKQVSGTWTTVSQI